MSSQTNSAGAAMEVEHNASLVAPRSPTNFPIESGSDVEDSDENFLLELQRAEEELGLHSPGLATSQAPGKAQPQKPRWNGKNKTKTEGHRVEDLRWNLRQSRAADLKQTSRIKAGVDTKDATKARQVLNQSRLQCNIREQTNMNNTKAHPFHCSIEKASHPTDALSAVEFLMTDHTGAAHAGGSVLSHLFMNQGLWNATRAPFPLASAIPAAAARQIFRMTNLNLRGGKVTGSGYVSLLVRAADGTVVASQEVGIARRVARIRAGNLQLSERPERRLRTGGGACGEEWRQTLAAGERHESEVLDEEVLEETRVVSNRTSGASARQGGASPVDGGWTEKRRRRGSTTDDGPATTGMGPEDERGQRGRARKWCPARESAWTTSGRSTSGGNESDRRQRERALSAERSAQRGGRAARGQAARRTTMTTTVRRREEDNGGNERALSAERSAQRGGRAERRGGPAAVTMTTGVGADNDRAAARGGQAEASAVNELIARDNGRSAREDGDRFCTIGPLREAAEPRRRPLGHVAYFNLTRRLVYRLARAPRPRFRCLQGIRR
ncbi:hypothetical protein C8R47DRAFT_1066777 [Mycena vitilis]|nr:hypothetical protein C8R47DRAFT_1066777 [Mycena vitilis]